MIKHALRLLFLIRKFLLSILVFGGILKHLITNSHILTITNSVKRNYQLMLIMVPLKVPLNHYTTVMGTLHVKMTCLPTHQTQMIVFILLFRMMTQMIIMTKKSKLKIYHCTWEDPESKQPCSASFNDKANLNVSVNSLRNFDIYRFTCEFTKRSHRISATSVQRPVGRSVTTGTI